MAGQLKVGSICERLELLARAKGLQSLSMWLKLAASDAYFHDLQADTQHESRIGIWDWDITNNLDHANPITAEFFGMTPDNAALGLPVEDYIKSVHQEDVPQFLEELKRSTAPGETFALDFRVIANNRLRGLSGLCSADASGRPVRMMGSLVDITSERRNSNVVSMRK
jgi:PAS domain-containing protein